MSFAAQLLQAGVGQVPEVDALIAAGVSGSVYTASSYTLSRCWICNMHVIIKLWLN